MLISPQKHTNTQNNVWTPNVWALHGPAKLTPHMRLFQWAWNRSTGFSLSEYIWLLIMGESLISDSSFLNYKCWIKLKNSWLKVLENNGEGWDKDGEKIPERKELCYSEANICCCLFPLGLWLICNLGHRTQWPRAYNSVTRLGKPKWEFRSNKKLGLEGPSS